MSRDYSKVLTHKMTYNKSNQSIINDPSLHAMAIYLGIRSERSSRILEQICLARVLQLRDNLKLTKAQYHLLQLQNKYLY